MSNKKAIYLYDYQVGHYIRYFEDEDALYRFIKGTYHIDWEGKYRNYYLEYINLNGNDMILSWSGYDKQELVLRPYLFITEENRIIDPRIWKDKIEEELKEENPQIEPIDDELQYGDILYKKYGKTPFRYRIDPVPHIWHRGKRYCGIRHPKTYQEIKKNSDPDYKEFVRPKRRNLPTSWDDIPRNTQRSWKEQSKKRKQWM